MHHPIERITHITAFVTAVVEHWLECEIAQGVHHEGSIQQPIAPRDDALPQSHMAVTKPSYFKQLINIKEGRKEGNVLFNDALKIFYLRLYGVGHMVKDHTDCERGNPMLPHGLLFPINSKGSFISTIPQTG